MTKKDYIATAKTFNLLPAAQTVGLQYCQERKLTAGKADAFAAGYRAATVKIMEALADQFAKDNPAFDRSRFLAACGSM